MKLIKYIIVAAALFMAAGQQPATAREKEKPQRVYMFGFAASFNDTIVHFTDIQPVDSVWINKRSNFVSGLNNYSNQMRDYLTKQQQAHRTCVVFSARKIGRLQKKFLKMKKLYSTSKKGQTVRNDIRFIPASDFKFKAFNIGTED